MFDRTTNNVRFIVRPSIPPQMSILAVGRRGGEKVIEVLINDKEDFIRTLLELAGYLRNL